MGGWWMNNLPGGHGGEKGLLTPRLRVMNGDRRQRTCNYRSAGRNCKQLYCVILVEFSSPRKVKSARRRPGEHGTAIGYLPRKPGLEPGGKSLSRNASSLFQNQQNMLMVVGLVRWGAFLHRPGVVFSPRWIECIDGCVSAAPVGLQPLQQAAADGYLFGIGTRWR